ncbi:hypothetical protein Plhal304r1_c020g0071931 [Plasmopara halstedii]
MWNRNVTPPRGKWRSFRHFNCKCLCLGKVGVECMQFLRKSTGPKTSGATWTKLAEEHIKTLELNTLCTSCVSTKIIRCCT